MIVGLALATMTKIVSALSTVLSQNVSALFPRMKEYMPTQIMALSRKPQCRVSLLFRPAWRVITVDVMSLNKVEIGLARLMMPATIATRVPTRLARIAPVPYSKG